MNLFGFFLVSLHAPKLLGFSDFIPRITISQTLHYPLQGEGFSILLELFMNEVSFWNESTSQRMCQYD